MSFWQKWKRRIKKVLIVNAVLLAVFLFIFIPSAGPGMATALPPDAELLVYATNITELWERLESSERFAKFRKKALWSTFEKSELGEHLLKNYELLKSYGVTPSRVSLVAGEEVGLAVVESSGKTEIILALRIGLVGNVAEIILRKLNLEELKDFEWRKDGDLFVISSNEALLKPLPDADIASRFNLSTEAISRDMPSFALGLNNGQKMFERYVGRDRAAQDVLTLIGLPHRFKKFAVSLRVDGNTIFEEESIEGRAPTRSLALKNVGVPAETFFRYDFAPGRRRAIELVMSELMGVLGPRVDYHLMLSGALNSVLGRDARLLLIMQEPDAPRGGFPAELIMVEVTDPALWRNTLRTFFESRGRVKIFNEGDALPSSYPYVVTRRAGDAEIFEIVISLTRRHEGYRPCLAILKNAVVFSTSFKALSKYVTTPSEQKVQSEEWLKLEGEPLASLNWVTPLDLSSLENSYNFMLDLKEHSPEGAEMFLSNNLDMDLLWEMVASVLEEIKSYRRGGAFSDNQTHMRGVWQLNN